MSEREYRRPEVRTLGEIDENAAVIGDEHVDVVIHALERQADHAEEPAPYDDARNHIADQVVGGRDD